MQFNERRQEDVSIDLTPFIDVVFMLLLFFVVSTSFYKNVNILGIQLPKANTQKLDKMENVLEVGVSSSGEYSLNGHILGTESARLKTVLDQKIKENAAVPVLIVGDQKAPHQAIVSALEVAEQIGIKEVKIVAKGHEGI